METAAAMKQVDTIRWRGDDVPVFAADGCGAFVRVADMPGAMRAAMQRWHASRGDLAIARPPCGGAYFVDDVRAMIQINSDEWQP